MRDIIIIIVMAPRFTIWPPSSHIISSPLFSFHLLPFPPVSSTFFPPPSPTQPTRSQNANQVNDMLFLSFNG